MMLHVGTTERGDPIHLTANDLKAHAHGIGASRKGKSKLIEHIIRELVKREHGFCLIDPNGFLYRDVIKWLAYIEPRRVPIIPFDLTYTEKVIGFNPFILQGEKTEATIS